ncbi:SDR family NAD(P)-dependent oxidoreductase [Hylemonella sp. W303a]|uniref:SDR family NAD(P)-dependent oxidoreductase n=1 Tax=Hylemonella sp. W303a TaxID=3389873 RepID=UPI00396B479C
MHTMDLIVLTGATRGLGLAMAGQLISQYDPGQAGQRHLHLLCISRGVNDSLADQAQQVRKTGFTLMQWPLDLSRSVEAGNALGRWLREQDGENYVSATLINNAGVIPGIAPLATLTPEEISQALRVNLEAPMSLSAAFLGATDRWAEEHGTRRKILNISSGLGRRPMASQAVYCAAKAGMDHYTRCLALEEARKPHGAKVCALAPGVVDTDMQAQMRGADAAVFPDRERFNLLQSTGLLDSPAVAARKVLAWLARPDFGQDVVADVRDD